MTLLCCRIGGKTFATEAITILEAFKSNNVDISLAYATRDGYIKSEDPMKSFLRDRHIHSEVSASALMHRYEMVLMQLCTSRTNAGLTCRQNTQTESLKSLQLSNRLCMTCKFMHETV